MMSNEEMMVRASNEVATLSSAISLAYIRANAQRFPRLHSYTKEDAFSRMRQVVYQAFMYRGQNADDRQIDFITSALLNEIMDDKVYGLPNITFAEIGRAIKKAILTDPEIYGISVFTLYNILVNYAKGEGHDAEEEVRKKGQEAINEAQKANAKNTMMLAYAGELVRRNKK